MNRKDRLFNLVIPKFGLHNHSSKSHFRIISMMPQVKRSSKISGVSFIAAIFLSYLKERISKFEKVYITFLTPNMGCST